MNLIDDFKNQIILLQEPELGDFRRRATLYINRLSEQMHGKEKTLEKLNQMRETTLNQPFEDPEDLREFLLETLDKL